MQVAILIVPTADLDDKAERLLAEVSRLSLFRASANLPDDCARTNDLFVAAAVARMGHELHVEAERGNPEDLFGFLEGAAR